MVSIRVTVRVRVMFMVWVRGDVRGKCPGEIYRLKAVCRKERRVRAICRRLFVTVGNRVGRVFSAVCLCLQTISR